MGGHKKTSKNLPKAENKIQHQGRTHPINYNNKTESENPPEDLEVGQDEMAEQFKLQMDGLKAMLQSPGEKDPEQAYKLGLLGAISMLFDSSTKTNRDLKRINESLQEDNNWLKNKVSALTSKTEELEERLRTVEASKRAEEIQKSKKCLILKKVPYQGKSTEGKDEKMEDLTNFVKELSNSMNNDENSIIRAERLNVGSKVLEQAKKKGFHAYGPIKIKFGSNTAKSAFLQNLRNLDDEYKYVQVDMDIPVCARKRAAELNSLAFKMRKKNEGLKTKMAWRNLDLVLMAKGPKEQKYSVVDDATEAAKYQITN